MRLQSSLPAGVSALLFASAKRLRRLEGELVAELEARGFDEAILPVLDFYSPYETLLPAASRSELHRFAGRDGELLALRSDFTPMLARLLAPHLAALALPQRIYYRGDVVRARAGAAAPADTEPYQLGGELFGRESEGAALEREAALLFARLFARVLALAGGAGRIVLGFAGALDELLVAAAGREAAPELARAVARRERAAARAAGSSASALLEIVESGAPGDGARLGATGAAALAELARIRDAIASETGGSGVELGVGVDLAEFADFSPLGLPAEGAALDLRSYYGGLVMRAYLPRIARPVASGGRYDELFRRSLQAGGAALDGDAGRIAAVGFSFRLDLLANETSSRESGAGAPR
jgi:ATP phosphoribosyltransferase regulatory subunit